MNRLQLSATVVSLDQRRYTPAGLPAQNLTLRHESQLSEAGQQRSVTVELDAVAIGVMAERLAALAPGTQALFDGFLATPMRGRKIVFHIQNIQQDRQEH